jgi:hypothetical protein
LTSSSASARDRPHVVFRGNRLTVPASPTSIPWYAEVTLGMTTIDEEILGPAAAIHDHDYDHEESNMRSNLATR